jgi:hypothetical protein
MTVPHIISLRNDHWKSGVLAITGAIILACRGTLAEMP